MDPVALFVVVDAGHIQAVHGGLNAAQINAAAGRQGGLGVKHIQAVLRAEVDIRGLFPFVVAVVLLLDVAAVVFLLSLSNQDESVVRVRNVFLLPV
ncbi:hypothetical protein BgiMline_000960 [Biomphalaria glabrata]